MGYWEGDNYVDGPKFVAWLERCYPDRLEMLCSDRSWSDRVTKWRNRERARAHIDTIDPLLVRFDVHPGEIPEDVWAIVQTRRMRRQDTCRNGHLLPRGRPQDKRGYFICPTCAAERAAETQDRIRERSQARWERQEQARVLRARGLKWQDIAAELGYSCAGAAYTAARAAAQRELVAA